MEDSLDLNDIILWLWRNKILVIIITIIFAIFGLVKTEINLNNSVQKDLYFAGTKIIIDEPQKIVTTDIDGTFIDRDVQASSSKKGVVGTSSISTEEKLINTYKEILLSKDLLNNVIEELNLNMTVTELKNSITVTPVAESYLVNITVKYNDEKKVIDITNKLLEKLTEKLNGIYNIEKISVIESANILSNSRKSYLEIIKTTIIYAVVGFVLTCGILVIREIFNSSVKNEDQIKNIIKLKNLSKIKKVKNEDNQDRFRFLRVNLNGCKTLLVTSPEKADGKTYVANNLAKSFAKQGKKVILIDLVKNTNELIKNPSDKGLLDYLNCDDKFVEKYALETSYDNLQILPLGNDITSITELLESHKMQEAINTLERLYDVIIIDSQNVLESANTLAIAKIAKYSLLVVSERKTKLENIIKAKNNIEDLGGNIVGTVLNKTYK